MNPYTVLKINKYSTEDEVRLAYRRLMKKHHPDSGDGDIQKLNEAKSAYILLKDSNQAKVLIVPIIINVTNAELAKMLGTTQIFEYETVHFEVYIPYETRMGDTIKVKNILPDTILKIKFRENK